jgi:hypothetical protein
MINRIGAATPIVSYEGRHPIPKVGTEIRRIELKNATFLPNRSPKWPKKIPPKGLIIKPAANAPKLEIRDAVGSSEGKKIGASIKAK